MSKKSKGVDLGAFSLSPGEFSITDDSGVRAALVDPYEETIALLPDDADYYFADRHQWECFVRAVNKALESAKAKEGG